MTLITHGIAGAAIMAVFPGHPFIAGVAAFGSHFILDAIPHSDFPLRSTIKDPANHLNDDISIHKTGFAGDMVRVCAEGALGVALAFIFFRNLAPWYLLVLGAILGQFPDALQFLYWKIRREPFLSLYKFHPLLVHSKKHLSYVCGYLLESVIDAVIVLSTWFIFVR